MGLFERIKGTTECYRTPSNGCRRATGCRKRRGVRISAASSLGVPIRLILVDLYQIMHTKLTSQLIALTPGVYILALKDPAQYPGGVNLGFYPTPASEGAVTFFMAGDKTPRSVAFLQHPQAEVLVRVRQAQSRVLLVDFARADRASSQPIAVKIDRLEHKDAQAAVKKSNADQSVGVASPWLPAKGRLVNGKSFSAPRGVVGSPDATQPIAAFGLDGGSLPPGVRLAYTCRKRGMDKLFTASAGGMVGSETEDPIAAIAFTATGPEGGHHEIKGHVVFAGCPPLAIVSGKELSGPTGREILVALRVAVTNTADTRGNSPKKSVWDDPAVLKSKTRSPHNG